MDEQTKALLLEIAGFLEVIAQGADGCTDEADALLIKVVNALTRAEYLRGRE